MFGFRKRLAPVFLVVGMAYLFWPTGALDSDNFNFYLPSQHRMLSSETIDGIEYLPVIELLNIAGGVSRWEEKRSTIRIWFGDRQLELRNKRNKIKLGKSEFTLSAPVLTLNGQWVVPADFIPSILPQMIGQPVRYSGGSKTVIIGNVKPLSYSVRLDPIADGARLTLQFTAPVRIRTVSQNGKWVLYLGGGPVQPSQEQYRFQSPYVQEVQFDDHDGVPKIILTPGQDGLNFYVSSSTQSMIAEVVKPPSAPAAQQAHVQNPSHATPAPQQNAPPAASVTQQAASLPVVVLDAGHGGQDAGGRGSNGVLEKDLVAQITQRVGAALTATQKYRVVETRVGDSDPGFDERALTANTAHPIVFISFHAGSFGEAVPRLAVYTYQPSAPGAASDANGSASGSRADPPSLFVPWQEVQSSHLDRSRQLARALAGHFANISGATAPEAATAPVRVLRSVDAPAVAVEVGSLSSAVDPAPLTDSNFQQQVSAAVVQAIRIFAEGHP